MITDIEGFSPEIGRLVSMMHYARWTTLQAVAGLTREELDRLHDPDSNTIGGLLLHIAAIEFSYQLATLEDRTFTAREWQEWRPALELGELGRREIRGQDLEYYEARLRSVRDRTLECLRRRDDSWLLTEKPFWGGRPANHFFMWFHVVEDELNHRGQIRWLRKRL